MSEQGVRTLVSQGLFLCSLKESAYEDNGLA